MYGEEIEHAALRFQTQVQIILDCVYHHAGFVCFVLMGFHRFSLFFMIDNISDEFYNIDILHDLKKKHFVIAE